MPICPIDTGRYGSKEMKDLFEETNRLQMMLKVEAALAETLADLGEIPAQAAKEIKAKAKVAIVTPEMVRDRERKTHHDLMAMVDVLAEQSGASGRYVHWGATSYDIVDTSWALVMRDATAILGSRLKGLRDTLCDLALKNRDLAMVGRTHGQHATPITFGLKMAVYAAETARNIERLVQLERRLLVGKISGATGTMASQGRKALEIEAGVMKRLDLRAAEVTTQVVCRDRMAEFVCWAAITASGLDRISTEIRNLQRTEISEVAEGFDAGTQVGSSTMPHKQNPVDCEKVSGLAKVVRGMVVPALENIVLWHERDLTDSSSERFILPLTFIILDEMLVTIDRVLKNLRIYPRHMKENLGLTKGAVMTEAVMMALARKGMSRQKAHALLRKASERALAGGLSMGSVLWEEPEVRERFSKQELEELLNPSNYLGKAREITERAVKYAKSVG